MTMLRVLFDSPIISRGKTES